MRGSVGRRGKTWTVRWSVPGPKRQQRSKGGFATKKEAESFLSTQLTMLGHGHVESKISLNAFAAQWLAAIAHEVSPSTLAGYETHWRVWLSPVVGHLRLMDLTAVELQGLYAKVLSAGRSPRTARYVHATAHRMFSDAIRWGLASRNPADGARPPALDPKEKRTWTAEQTATFLESVAGSRWEPLWWLAADSAARRGELAALTWDQFGGDTVTIYKGKTKAARRTITLLPETLRQMTQWRLRQLEERLAAGPYYLSGNRVWTWEDGRPIRTDWLTHSFTRIIEKHGLPDITLHQLRHSWATQALDAGIPLPVVQHRLGHSSITITSDFYTAVPDDMDRAATNAVGGLWVRAPNAHGSDVG